MVKETGKIERLGRRSFVVPYIGSRCDTFGLDNDSSFWLLLDNLSGEVGKTMLNWGRENQIFSRQFRGQTTKEAMSYQENLVSQAAEGFNNLVGFNGSLANYIENSGFVNRLLELDILPDKELSETGKYLKPQKAEEFLSENPPEKLLVGSNYSSIKDLFQTYSPALVMGLARRSESSDWMMRYKQWTKTLKPEDLINKNIDIRVIDRNEFPTLHPAMETKMANDDRLSGTVWMLTVEPAVVSKPTTLLRQTFWLLHYIYELHNFGTKYSQIFEGKDSEFNCHLATVFAPGMNKSEHEDVFFDLHALMEGVFWQRSFLQLSNFSQDLSEIFKFDYPGIDKLVITKGDKGEEVVGFHPFNMVNNVHTGKISNNSTTKRVCKLGVLQKVVNKNLDEVEDLLLSSIELGHFGI